MRPRKIRQTKIPLYWVNGGNGEPNRKQHIGYYFPERNIIATSNGNFSTLTRMNPDGRTVDQKNKMHIRRVQAAYSTKDFTYYGD